MARPLREPLTYAIPDGLAGVVKVGHVVLVPLGRTSETGYVVGFVDDVAISLEKVKSIARIVDPIPAFGAEQLAFFEWISVYYLASLGMVIHTAIPSQLGPRILRVVEPTGEGVDALTSQLATGRDAQVLREIIARPGLTRRGMMRRLDGEVESKQVGLAINALEKQGWVVWNEREVGGSNRRLETVIMVGSRTEAAARIPRLGARMSALLDALERAGGEEDVAALVAESGSSGRASLNRMVAHGAVVKGSRELRDPFDVPAMGSATPPRLNPDQIAALDAITASDGARTWLLHGVTGSGKTEVFLGATRTTLDRGKQILVLVPEIGLTPQLVGRFRSRFGPSVAVLHSGLTGAQRISEWRRIRAGEADVAIGARSALFAPFRDLGLIVVDEEHDDSYKQDEGVRYHARDLAVVLGRMCSCPVVLASATPSLESWNNAAIGRYSKLDLPKRATPRPLPVIERIDLSELEKGEDGRRPLFAPQVVQGLRTTFDRGAKAIVLYNRRGYATMVECQACGATWECPNCGISMTLHRRAGVMACHYCALRRPYDDRCTACQSTDMEIGGKGTERVLEELERLFPDVAAIRMDADTTRARGSHHRILEAFRTGEARLLVGTQIVAKGHDFPDVQTAVVVSADRGVRMPDFRAAERTWALLVQVAGRAGRGEVAGRVFVQTWRPDHYVLKGMDQVAEFYRTELRLRSTMSYPPFTRLCLIRVDGTQRERTRRRAEDIAKQLRRHARRYRGVGVLGPSPAALARLVGRWRFQIICRGTHTASFRAFLKNECGDLPFQRGKGVRLVVDVDPRHLM